MAKSTIIISDISGAPANNHATVTIRLDSKPNRHFVLDADESEVADLLSKATERKAQGRPKK